MDVPHRGHNISRGTCSTGQALVQSHTRGDAQAGAHSVQRGGVALAGDGREAMLGRPLAAHVVRRLEGRLPVHPGAPAQGGPSQNVDT